LHAAIDNVIGNG